MPVGLRAGWVPCVGFQPIKPSVVSIEEADNPIAQECERAFKRIRETHPDDDGAAAASAPEKGPAGYEARRPVSLPPLDDEDNKEKPAMKLLMSSKGVQDMHQVQEHYQNLMNQATPNPEVSKIVTEISSPTGKGAELFAKRKKRMDKFIVDETTVQKSQQTSLTQQSSTASSFSSSSSSQNISAGVSVGVPAGAPGTGAIYTAEVKVVQRASLPPTPIDVPHHSLLELVTEEEKADKRSSACFNLAAKGWGTYNKFYTAVTFATKS